MRSSFHFVQYNLKILFTSPRPYITLLILFSIMQVGMGGAKGYLIEHGQTFQAVELYVFTHSSHVVQLIFILGLLLLLGDAPFLKEGMSFHLIRTNRFQWLLGQFLSCIVISAVYLLAIEFLFLVVFLGHVNFQNKWSDPVILAAQVGMERAIGIEIAVLFSMNVIRAGSPYAMFGLTVVYSLLLYSFSAYFSLPVICGFVAGLDVLPLWRFGA